MSWIDNAKTWIKMMKHGLIMIKHGLINVHKCYGSQTQILAIIIWESVFWNLLYGRGYYGIYNMGE